MKSEVIKLLMIILLLALVACGSNGDQMSPTKELAATQPPAATEPAEESDAGASSATDDAAAVEPETSEVQEGESTDDSSSAMLVPAGDEGAAGVAGGPLATAEASGLPINPDPVVPGEAYIILGTIINVAMIPVDAPQFLIEGDNGVRYRVNAQAVADIFVEDGTQLQPHQFRPGLRVIATALLPADATASDVAATTDLVVLLDE